MPDTQEGNNMKKIVGELLKNKNIEEHLREYPVRFMELNYRYALIRLAMNYYTYYSMMEENEVEVFDHHHEISEINAVVAALWKDEGETEKQIETMEALRKKIVTGVQDLTCYVDRLNVYEHALNRVEYRFKEQKIPDDYSDEDMTRRLMKFILEDEDSVAVNEKIHEIIAQLPLRMTKDKFFELVSQGLSIYQGGSIQSLDDFLYMLETAGMLKKTASMAENYPHLEEVMEAFEKINFKTISQQEYEEMRYNIEKSSETIESVMSGNLMIQEIINDLLLVLYTKDYAEDTHASAVAREIVENTGLLFQQKFSSKSAEEIEAQFVFLEGSQEELYPKLSAYDITDQIRDSFGEKIQALGLTEVYEIVYRLPKLNSDSLFVELEEQKADGVATEAYVKKQQERLFEQYRQLFRTHETSVRRAVMSMTLAELPVFFNNISELQDYIYNSLSICTDNAEKLACIEILNNIAGEQVYEMV